MAPKKKIKVGASAATGAAKSAPKSAAGRPAAAAAPTPDEDVVNRPYLADVSAAILTIQGFWPGIQTAAPLPLTSADGGMTGFVAPFDDAAFDAQFQADGMQLQYTCGINLFWLNPLLSVTPFVPITKSRVLRQAATLTPGVFQPALVAHASWERAAQMPRGAILRVSPDELVHSLIFKVAERIEANASTSELDQWQRTLLSMPCCFKRFDTDDARYAESNSIRNEIGGVAKLIVFSARQVVYNIWGFKVKKQASTGGRELSAGEIADFWDKHVKKCEGSESLHKKSAIDACLTLYQRVFSIPECERIVRQSEEKYGADSAWNSIWKLQEIVYRAKTAGKIEVLMVGIQDWMDSGKISPTELTVTSIKSQTRTSISDVILYQYKLKEYVLGEWLDGKNFPSYIKAKARTIFASIKSYRLMYQPVGAQDLVDLNWMFAWPKCGLDLLQFLDSMLYGSSCSEDSWLRQAVKNAKTPAEVMAWPIWAERATDLLTELSRTAVSDTASLPGSAGAAAAAAQQPPAAGAGDADSGAEDDDSGAALTAALKDAAIRLARRLCFYCVEPPSQAGIGDLIKASPLGSVRACPDTGNVLILLDCNCYGETDSKPHLRQCPMPKAVFDKLLKGVIQGRYNVEETPEQLHLGDIFLCFDAGKDRRRLFMKPLTVKKGAKDPNRNAPFKIMLHCSEDSVRERRGRARGKVKCSQGIHVVTNRSTVIPARSFKIHNGSTRSDVFGPVAMDKLTTLPTIAKVDKPVWWGKRLVRAGGKEEGSDVEAEEEESDDGADEAVDESDQQRPMSYHCLPVTVVTDLVEGMNVKHVIDLTPTPLPLALNLLMMGCSYFAVCASERMRDELTSRLHSQLVGALKDPTNPLFDRRFVASGAPAEQQEDGPRGDGGGGGGPPGEGGADPVPPPAKGRGRGRGKGRRGGGGGGGPPAPAAADAGGAPASEGGGGGVDLAGLLAAARQNLAVDGGAAGGAADDDGGAA